MPRTISIRATPLFKFVLAPLWLAVAAYAMWAIWTSPERVLTEYESGTRLALQVILLALLAASAAVAVAYVIPLKRVRLQADGLAVSNYQREVVVPFAEIASVRQHSLPTFRLITVRLRNDGGLGRRVIFMPTVPMRTAFWRSDYGGEDEIVGELRSLAGLRRVV